MSILVIIFVLGLIVYLLDRRYSYWKRRNVPYIKPELFYGNTRDVGKKISRANFYRNLYFRFKKMGPIGGFYDFTQPVVMVTDLDLIKSILVSDFHVFVDRGIYHNEKDDPASASIERLTGERWKILRNKLSPAFATGKIKMMFPIINEVANRMIDVIGAEKQAVEMKLLFAKFTTDVVGKAAFGLECNSLKDETTQFYQYGIRYISNLNSLKRFLLLNYQNLARRLGLIENNLEITEFYKNVVNQTVNYRKEAGVVSQDYLAHLMSLKDRSLMTFDEVWTSSITFFIGGYETTSSTLNYCMYELSQNEGIRRKARQSVREALNKFDGEFTYDAINSLQYIDQCIRETLRKYPPIFSVQRTSNRIYNVPNTKITLKRGSRIYIPVYGIHHDPEFYPDPMIFDPDRFAPEEVAKRHHMSFMPFSEGLRMCLGKRFALIEIKVVLAKILLNFDFELERSMTPVPLGYVINRSILTPSSGVYIKFRKITDKKE